MGSLLIGKGSFQGMGMHEWLDMCLDRWVEVMVGRLEWIELLQTTTRLEYLRFLE